jgi:uncharacterized protein involved in exopolysaccharide biosynthesis
MDQTPMKVPEGFLLETVRHDDVVRSMLSVPFKWKWLIVSTFLAIVLPVAFFALSKLPQFRATARIIVKQDRAYLTMTPAAEDRTVSFPVSRNTINSELRIIKSREVVERAVEELEKELAETDISAKIDDSVLPIREKLEVNPVPDSNVIEISYVDDNPGFAVKIVNQIAETYQGRHAEINRPQGAHEFFERQASTYMEKLRDAERRLKEFEKEQGIADLEKELADTRALINRLQSDAQTTAVQIKEERTRLDYLKEEIKKQPQRIATSEETVLNRTSEQLRARLLQLEQEKTALLQLYTEKDRRIIGKQQEIDAVRRSLEAEDTYVAGRKASDLNPTRRALEQDLVSGQARLTALVTKERVVNQQLGGAQNRLAHIDSVSFKFEELKRAVDLSQQNLTVFHKRSEEARIADAMDQEKLVNVAILERAALPLEPMAGGKRGTLLLAALAGLVLGVGAAFGIEFFNTSANSEKVLEEQLDLPVLATIEKFLV